MKAGNNAWWDQVRNLHEGMPPGTHFKTAELEVFRILYTRMIGDGMTQGAIREHFKEVFNLGYSAFYGRLRKVGCQYVIP
jgi:hypothetical protein